MKKVIVVICVFLLLCLGIGGLCHKDGAPRTVAVTGQCLTTAPKDRTAITLRVTTLDKSAAVSMKQATALISEITDALRDMDVKMQTTQFNSYEKTEWDHNAQKSVSRGIETTIALQVSANNIETIEQILSKFAGRDNIFSEDLHTYTSAETMQPILEKCLGTAVENARTRANALAAGDGRRAGKLLSVSYDTNATHAQPRYSNFMMAKESMAVVEDAVATAGSIVSKDTELSVTVSAIFEIR